MADPHLTPEQTRAAELHAPHLKVFGALLALIVLEYGYARLGLSFVALASGLAVLAAIYAFLVAWFFMHLKFEGRWIYLMLVPVGVLTVVVLAGLTPDIAYHQLGFFQSTAVADR